MKLSEGMRLGAMLNGQAFGTLEDENGNTCALGALRKAVGIPARQLTLISLFSTHEELVKRFPVLEAEAPPHCPGCGLSLLMNSTVADMIVHLNNDDCWTRERIADWVEGIENEKERLLEANHLYEFTTD